MTRAEMAEKVLQAVEKWRNTYQPLCVESIWQTDRCLIAAPELVEDTMNIVGYYIEDAPPFDED